MKKIIILTIMSSFSLLFFAQQTTNMSASNINMNTVGNNFAISMCNKSLNQSLNGFNPNPVYSLWTWSFDTLTITNTSNCAIRVRPEFNIYHENIAISQGDFDLKWLSPLGNWLDLNYNITTNGHAVGFWSFGGDTTGQTISQGDSAKVIIKTRFRPGANYGTYYANWQSPEVDSSGNFIQIIGSGDSTSLSFIDCSIYNIDSINNTNITCFGNNNGSGSILSIENGSNEYLYNWSNGDTTNSISNLSAGNYHCIVTDKNWQECNDSIGFTIYEPTELITITDIFHTSCYGICDGQILNNTSGGTFPYSYSWDSGNTWSYSANLDSLCPGNYTLSVIDNNGCVENISPIQIIEANPINLNIDSLFNITSYGGNNGYIYISLNGGSGQLNTNWSSDNGFSSNNEDILNIAAGFYYLEITDVNSCIYLDTFELIQPPLLWANIDNVINANCYSDCNGSISITANGGNSNYSYSWIGPNGFSSNNDDISNLCYGAYIITINDGSSSSIDTINIYQPQPITSNLTADSILCHNGSSQVSINVWGGTQPLTYNWSNGDSIYYTTFNSGSHSITVTDINGCNFNQSFNLSNPDSIITSVSSVTHNNCFGDNNGSVNISIVNGGTAPFIFSINNGINYQGSNTFNNLFAGSYSFLVSDLNGCLSSTSADILETLPMISTINTIDASCFGNCDGSISAITSGGTPPYIYNWNNGTNNLCAGLQNVIVSDINGCLEINSAIVNEPLPILINVWINGNNLVATSGFSFYQWFDNNNDSIAGANNAIFTPTVNGSYYVTVRDTNGCSEDSYMIEYNISKIENHSLNTKIFPNPTTGKLKINSEYIIRSISVYNSLGNQLIMVDNKNNIQTDHEIDLSTFVKGLYYIKMNINNQILHQRIILQ